MTTLPLGDTDFRRSVAQSPFVRVRNRYFEINPTNQVEEASLLTRPALKRWKFIGTGPIRGIFSQPGSFDDALFALSGQQLWRVDTDSSSRLLASGFFGAGLNTTAYASMAATAAIGSTPEALYIADGTNLWLYQQDTFATGELVVVGAIIATEVVRIGSIYYAFTAGSVDAGAPAGTIANPWLVALGVDTRSTLALLVSAINATGTAGSSYSTGLIANTEGTAISSTVDTMQVQAVNAGLSGNSVSTTTTISGGTFSGSTMGGGADEAVSVVDLPDGLAAVAVAFIAGYVIVVPASRQGFKGRFFWIEPGETFIQPLNFATAERSPDPVFSVRTVGDQFWLLGKDSIETWYPTGDVLTPFVRQQGQVFDNGIIEGTDTQIRDTVILADAAGVVYVLTGGGPRRVSDNSIEERIRLALRAQS